VTLTIIYTHDGELKKTIHIYKVTSNGHKKILIKPSKDLIQLQSTI